jgi:hypothetical protein
MKAFELKPEQQFKLKGQRNYRTVIRVLELTNHDHIPPVGRKVLIIYDGCKQLSLLKETDVIIQSKK